MMKVDGSDFSRCNRNIIVSTATCAQARRPTATLRIDVVCIVPVQYILFLYFTS